MYLFFYKRREFISLTIKCYVDGGQHNRLDMCDMKTEVISDIID